MFAILPKYIIVWLLLAAISCLCSGSSSNTGTTETPGFFLKVTKNVPRLGRRSPTHHSLSDFENFFLKTSKSVPRIGRSDSAFDSYATNFLPTDKRDPMTPMIKKYNSVQPFDSKSLHYLLASEEVTDNDIKFISWEDFDLALETDDGLFAKLLSIADEERSMPMLAQKLAQDTFVPLNNNHNEASKYFYRINRGGTMHD